MKLTEMNLFDEVFTHVDDVSGKQTSYNVTALYTHVSEHEDQVEKWRLPVEEHHAKYCITNRGVERDRIDVLMQKPEYLAKPILMVAMSDGSHLLVDGTHRYVTFWMLKVPEIPAYMIPWAVAEPFVIEGVPDCDETKLMEWSGLSVLRQLQEKLESE